MLLGVGRGEAMLQDKKANEPWQITCLYDMDIPRPDNFNETYLYEGMSRAPSPRNTAEIGQNSWNVIWLPSLDPGSR
jgi:hypothetical protein